MRLIKINICLGLLISIFLLSTCDNITGESGFADFEDGPEIVPAEDQHLSEELRTQYREDAEKLAIRYVNKRDSTQTEIPEDLIDYLYNGLIHIVNSDHPKAQEATEEYSVHARAPASPRKIAVYADTTAPWMDSWRNDQTETGDPQVDEIINKYSLTLVEYNELKNLPSAHATLQSDRAINMYAVGKLFETIDKVNGSGPEGIIGGGNDIKFLLFNSHLRFTFEYGYGDCPAGCINHHLWHFNIHEDGSVEFIDEEGPLPKDSAM